jgi:DNA polymerase bacteriophage-type
MSTLKRIVLDLETYYDDSYSLETLKAIPAYVFHPLFSVHGVAIEHPDGTREFRTDLREALADLRGEYGDELEEVIVVGHNMYFDYFVFHHVFGQKIRKIADTRSMSYLVNGPDQPASLRELAQLHRLPCKGDLGFLKGVRTPSLQQWTELANYAKTDVAITGGLFDRYLQEVCRTPIEFAIISHTIRMFVEKPFLVDLKGVEKGLSAIKTALAQELRTAGYTRGQISGNASFHRLLEEALRRTARVLPRKEGKRGPVPATAKSDEEMLRFVDDDDPKVRELTRLRLLVKSAPQKAKRLQYLKEAGMARKGAVHFELVYHRAIHGRFAGTGGFNIQNIPVPERTRDNFDRQVAQSLRESICARKPQVLAAADACQIEARVGAWIAGQEDLVEAFGRNADLYSEFASGVFGRPVRKPSQTDADHSLMQSLRNVGKRAILGLGYGMGVKKFIENLRRTAEGLDLFDRGILTQSVCARIVREYRQRYPLIPAFWHRCERAFRDAMDGFDSSLGGLRFFKSGGNTYIQLRSGRKLVYRGTKLSESDRCPVEFINMEGETDEFVPDQPEILYVTREAKGTRLFGPKIFEHIVSGTSRDILVHAIICLERQGWPVVSHCHDDIICEPSPDRANECLAAMVAAWRNVPEWAKGLVLDAEGKVGSNFAEIK